MLAADQYEAADEVTALMIIAFESRSVPGVKLAVQTKLEVRQWAPIQS